MPSPISAFNEDLFLFAKYINARVPEPASDDGSKKFRAGIMKDDFPELSRLTQSLFTNIQNTLPELQIKAVTSVPNALTSLQTKFYDLIIDLLSKSTPLAQARQLDISSPDQTNTLNTFAGGLHNAIEFYLAFAKLAYQKLEQLYGRNHADFDNIFKAILKNNRHASLQIASIHTVIMKLLENVNGINSNQVTPYTLKDENFGIYSKDNDMSDLYLLPTINHLNKIIQLSHAPNTTITNYSYKNGGTAPLIEKFSDLYKGPLIGCPLFGAKRMDGTKQIDLASEFFDTLDKIILDIVIPKKTKSGIFIIE